MIGVLFILLGFFVGMVFKALVAAILDTECHGKWRQDDSGHSDQ